MPIPKHQATRQGHIFEYYRADGGFCRLCGLQKVVVGRSITYRTKDGRELREPPRCTGRRVKPVWGTIPPKQKTSGRPRSR